MPDPDATQDKAQDANHDATHDTTQEEAFRIPDAVADALTEFAAVEQLSRGEAICAILDDYLRLKGYLKGTPRA